MEASTDEKGSFQQEAEELEDAMHRDVSFEQFACPSISPCQSVRSALLACSQCQ